MLQDLHSHIVLELLLRHHRLEVIDVVLRLEVAHRYLGLLDVLEHSDIVLRENLNKVFIWSHTVLLHEVPPKTKGESPNRSLPFNLTHISVEDESLFIAHCLGES